MQRKAKTHMAKEKRTLSDAAREVGSRSPLAHGVGRRKASVARVWLRHGSGAVSVNGKDYTQYFDTELTRRTAVTACQTIPNSGSFDILANVNGGGKVGQADAVKLAIARALVEFDPTLKPTLRKQNLLTVDSRKKERKKPGQPGARKKFQFVKR